MAVLLKKLSRFLQPSKERHQLSRGAILFLAVGAIAVLSILTLGASTNVLQELKLARYLTEANTSYYGVFSVMNVMRIVFATKSPAGCLTLYDLRDRAIPLGDISAQVHFYDEQSKINIRTASQDTLMRMGALASNSTLINTILAARARLIVKEELLLMEGMTKEIYDVLKENLTVFGAGSVNINTAAPEIFQALGMDEGLIEKIQQFKFGVDGQEKTEDDGVFANPGEILTKLEPFNLTSEQKTLLGQLIAGNQLGTTTGYVRLDITMTKAKRLMRSFKVVLELSTGKIASWQEE